jgi:hypothetical protein
MCMHVKVNNLKYIFCNILKFHDKIGYLSDSTVKEEPFTRIKLIFVL